ncbi:transmembrane protein 181 isoform X2 [Strongylocentrotus purpuratus]|uniref:Transmembrane protein 181 n=1 Tax=Strongylocentrotus purpuratus TaxID=7668 RepID=A0A7M7PIN4_STRPU|nr:transmembrane protein 181 isoform X2 [Strongylocentrotus purpuratus]
MKIPSILESSVQMRLYTLSKRQFVLVFICFFMAFGISLLIGIAGPNIQAYELQKQVENLPNGPFELTSPILNKFNKSLWLTTAIEVDDASAETFQKPFNVSIMLRGVAQDSSQEKLTSVPYNRSRKLSCEKGRCTELLLLHLLTLKYSTYIVTVSFQGLEKHHVTAINFYFRTYNPAFSNMMIWFRFVFLVITFIITCMFAHSLRKFSMRDWSIEQKWLSVILPLLLLYNDPIYPLTLLVDSWIPILLDNVFQATFLCALLLFWLCAYHGIRQSDRKWVKFYMIKLLIVGVLWVSTLVLTSWQLYCSLYDPTFNYKVDSGDFIGMVIFFLVVGGFYVLYLLFLVIRAFTELRSLPYMNLRLKVMTMLMLVVVAATITITIMRYGVNILNENFVTELSTYYKNCAEFLAFYSLLNCYLYTMAFVYSPSKNAHKDTYFKDNPTFSMLNESEDELIYGSDSEDGVHTSLTGNNRHMDNEEE